VGKSVNAVPRVRGALYGKISDGGSTRAWAYAVVGGRVSPTDGVLGVGVRC